MTVSLFLALLGIVLYAFATDRLARQMHAHGREQRNRGPLAIAALALGLHLAVHGLAAHALGRPDLHFFAALSLVAAGMAALSIAGAVLEHLDALGVLVFPLAALFLLLYTISGTGPTASALEWPIMLHAWLALLAYAALAVATLIALGLWMQERALRRRQLTGWVRALPPLTQTEALLFRTLLAGFALLTLALLVGLVFVENLLAQHLAHKTVFSLLSWGALAALLIGHWRWGWRGQTAVRWTLSAMVLLLLAYFGSRFVYELVLGR